MRPRFRPSALAEVNGWEYVVRFAFGGIVTMGTGLAAHAWGPSVGGLFLAFPAILPASLTLVQMHEGRRETVAEARGALLGTLGLLAFAALAWVLAARWPAALVLVVATAGWAVACAAAWTLVHARR